VTARRREPAPGVFRLVLPLPFPDLKVVNAYALAGDDGVTLVDCGIHDPARDDEHGWGALVRGLEACELRPTDIARLVVTHPHPDHYGMAARVVTESGCDLWMHRRAAKSLEDYRDPGGAVARLRARLVAEGLAADEVDELAGFEDWRAYVPEVATPSTWLSGGERFTAGTRAWEIVHTPGHSEAHVCLWSMPERALISGDHLLGSITPNVDIGEDRDDPLAEFLDSLRRVEELDPELVLPGHGRPFDDGGERARTLARHHDRRLGSILQVIRRRPCSASAIAEEIFTGALLHFHRRLALGETLAHLTYLVNRGEVERIDGPDGYLYVKASRAPARK
jgi:glyoxylase-like metal-dependent hydrolase (beta-lactamase superfamily II)